MLPSGPKKCGYICIEKMYMYIYIEGERERERERDTHNKTKDWTYFDLRWAIQRPKVFIEGSVGSF